MNREERWFDKIKYTVIGMVYLLLFTLALIFVSLILVVAISTINYLVVNFVLAKIFFNTIIGLLGLTLIFGLTVLAYLEGKEIYQKYSRRREIRHEP